mgnify:CR=1 FL=1
MSNLGPYQTMTTWAKKAGGPVKLALLLLGGGMLLGGITVKGGEYAIKKGKQAISNHKEKKKYLLNTTQTIYTINQDALCDEKLKFKVGNTFRVLESDGDATLIELIGDDNNPYIVSEKLLEKISDYKSI